MSSQERWMPSMQMPPAGFGVVRQQPERNPGTTNFHTASNHEFPGQAYTQPVYQYQQMGGSQNWSDHKKGASSQVLAEQSQKEKKFYEQKGKFMDYNKNKSKVVSADKMIENILSNPQPTESSLYQKRPQQSSSQFYPVNVVPQALPSQQGSSTYPQNAYKNEAHPKSNTMITTTKPKQALNLPYWLTDVSKIPELYSKAGGLVDNYNGWVDTSRAYMLLMKTNLSPTLLGVLWEMVNHDEPGRLRMTEFYGLLALVAVLQGGRQINSTEILRTLDKPVYPFIDHPGLANLIPHMPQDSAGNSPQVNRMQNSRNNLPVNPQLNSIGNLPQTNSAVTPQESAIENPPHQTSVLNTIPQKFVVNPIETKSSSGPIVYPPLKNDDDDGFDDFVSAPPPSNDPVTRQVTLKLDQKMNLPILGNSPDSPEADDFADFQSAPVDVSSVKSNLTPSVEDKYAVFREIGPKPMDDFADFPEPTALVDQIPEQKISTDIIESGYSDDPFGEFEEASLPVITHIPKILQPLKQPHSLVDDDFGDFMSSSQISEPATINVPDIKSETQSIASLELPALELTSDPNPEISAVQNNLNLESSLSAELFDLNLSADTYSSIIDPTPTPTSKPVETTIDSNSVNHPFKSEPVVESTPVPDKYSLIRDEVGKSKFCDPQIEAWRKCLESCKKMLEEGFNILECLSQQGTLLEECLKTSQMNDYLSNLNEVWKVSQRILTSCQRMSSSSSIQDLLCSNQSLWASVISITEMKFDKLCDSHDISATSNTCSVCLNSDGAELLYGGLYYHPPCANLWLNSVDLTLPTLSGAALL